MSDHPESTPERLRLGFCPVHGWYHRNFVCEHGYGDRYVGPSSNPIMCSHPGVSIGQRCPHCGCHLLDDC